MARRTIDYGIDLGTTNSSIACIQKGEVRVFKNYLDSETTPSVVRVDARGSIIVGRKAYDHHVDDANNTVVEFKRLMGTQEVKLLAASGKRMTPEDLSAEILKDLKITAKLSTGEDKDIEAAVITVPCNFEVVQCEATQRAAKLAGIKFAPLLQEPIAASIAYGFLEKMPRGYWVVYDLGGGTFDIAIMSAKEGMLSVVDHCGDNYLGGKDFDWKIVENIVYPALKSTYNLPGLGRNREYETLNAILKWQAEQAKIELSQRETTDIVIDTEKVKDKDGKSINISIPIKRNEYERLIEDFVEKTAQLFEQALKNQGLTSGDISQLLLVGGPTKTPFIRARLKDRFKIPIDYKIDPLTVVAQGAAIFAASQLLPDEPGTRDSSKVFIKLSYNPMTTEVDTLVGGKIEPKIGESLPGDMIVQLNRMGGDWQSGKIGLKDGAFFTNVSLLGKKVNTFQILLMDSLGNKIPCDPDTFSITQGISIAEPPLTRSIGVELEDGSLDKILEKGVSLPARSLPKKYFAAREVRPGEAQDMLKIKVIEGESEIAKRNRHLGTLHITGDNVRRPVPEGSPIEIVISVDQSKHVTASAYVECLDQTFKGVITNMISPKPEPGLLSKELEREEARLAEVKRDLQRTGDIELEKELQKKNVSEKIAEIKDDLKAAVGGDPDAIEKADRRIKDLQIVIDPLERLAEWPAKLKDFKSMLQNCGGTINTYGNNDDKDLLVALNRESEKVILEKNIKKLDRLFHEVIQLYWAVLFRQPGFWISSFQDMCSKPGSFTNREQSQELIREGSMALQRQDIDALKTVVTQLWELMPKEKVDEVQKRASDSGLRRSW